MNQEQGKALVKFAREAIDTFFTGKPCSDPGFEEKRGVFVTLKLDGRLRGCIGFTEPVYTLSRAILEAARAAAFRDPRFPAVTQDEMLDVQIEVSVLTKPKLIKKPLDKIKIGKHGLVVKKGMHSGLLLPQVFVEYESTPKEALEMTCEKAGLPKDAWKDAEVYTFSAEIFEE